MFVISLRNTGFQSSPRNLLIVSLNLTYFSDNAQKPRSGSHCFLIFVLQKESLNGERFQKFCLILVQHREFAVFIKFSADSWISFSPCFMINDNNECLILFNLFEVVVTFSCFMLSSCLTNCSLECLDMMLFYIVWFKNQW